MIDGVLGSYKHTTCTSRLYMLQKGALVTILNQGTRRLVDDPIFYKYCIYETDNIKSLYLCPTTLYSIHFTEVHKLTNILMNYCVFYRALFCCDVQCGVLYFSVFF